MVVGAMIVKACDKIVIQTGRIAKEPLSGAHHAARNRKADARRKEINDRR